jgi:hypothetical protein
MKICHVIFSCNRIKYLTQTLESASLFDFGDHDVHRILIDDYPRNRNPYIFKALARQHDIDELILHEENKGLTATWTEFFELLTTRNYDYVLHQEDDVVLRQKVNIDDMITALESHHDVCSVSLQRQPWYYHEDNILGIKEEDIPYKDYLLYKTIGTFSILTSLYPMNIAREPVREFFKSTMDLDININEGMLMTYLNHKYGYHSMTMKNADGSNIVEHIGEETTGKRLLEGEPNWEILGAGKDPNKKYCSRTGILLEV